MFERQFANDRTVPSEYPPSRHRHADLCRLTVDARAFKDFEKFGVGDNSGAPARQPGADPLENIGVPAGAAEQKSCEEAGHRAADDDGPWLAVGS